jgi:glutamate racemase
MDTRPLLFLDSGIGGIPYCRHFQLRNPGETLIYLADRAHFPYGKRKREELARIVPALMEELLQKAEPKIAVIACNTATVSALEILRKKYPRIPFVGTVPAVKPAVLESRSGVVGVLGTERTIGDPYTAELALKYRKDCRVRGIAAPELVEFIERRYGSAGEDEKQAMARSYVNKFRAAGVDAIVLGCTHFLFLQDEFRREAGPDIRVYDSLEGVSGRIESLLDEDGGAPRAGARFTPECGNAGSFLITGDGEPETSWNEWAARLGLRLSLLKNFTAPGTSPGRAGDGA